MEFCPNCEYELDECMGCFEKDDIIEELEEDLETLEEDVEALRFDLEECYRCGQVPCVSKWCKMGYIVDSKGDPVNTWSKGVEA